MCRSSASPPAIGRSPDRRAARARERSRPLRALAAWLSCALCATALVAQRGEEVAQTRHNLSVSGPGPIHALNETRICVFCHTPHNATPQTPLWNRSVEGQTYQVYTSDTLKAGPLGQPTGATKLCLSCHDGTIATGAVVVPSTGIAMAGGGQLAAGSLANLGVDLSGHHPVSFHYGAALPNDQLAAQPTDLTFGGVDELQCTTCHDPHKDTWGKFLVKDNRFSSLCTTCHKLQGWAGPAHATSLETWKKRCEQFSTLGLQKIYCPSTTNRRVTAEDYKATPGCIREAGDIAKQFNLTAMIEFARTSTHIATLSTSLKMIREANHPNVKQHFDFFHFWSGYSKFEDLDMLQPGEIAHVHFQDILDTPREIIDNNGRVIPGDGKAPIVAILKKLSEKQYRGALSVELFLAELTQGDPYDVATRIKQKCETVMRQAGVL